MAIPPRKGGGDIDLTGRSGTRIIKTLQEAKVRDIGARLGYPIQEFLRGTRPRSRLKKRRTDPHCGQRPTERHCRAVGGSME